MAVRVCSAGANHTEKWKWTEEMIFLKHRHCVLLAHTATFQGWLQRDGVNWSSAVNLAGTSGSHLFEGDAQSVITLLDVFFFFFFKLFFSKRTKQFWIINNSSKHLVTHWLLFSLFFFCSCYHRHFSSWQQTGCSLHCLLCVSHSGCALRLLSPQSGTLRSNYQENSLWVLWNVAG